jgi:FKBP-type peptidyl-prolyl cis-trans isomerase
MRRVVPLLLVLALTGCGGSDDKDTESVAQSSCTPSEDGTKDLTKKPVVTAPATPPPTTTTLVDIVCGAGEEAKAGSTVSVKYVGVLYAGAKEFDSSWNRGAEEVISFTIGSGVIPGFSKGATGMKVGGRRMVVIPPADGYGAKGVPPTIPGGATLIFVMDLVRLG